MITINRKYVWDYDLPKNWQPKTKSQWLWLLERKINYGDWKGIKVKVLKKYFPVLKRKIDPGKRMMIDNYFKIYGGA